MAAVAGAVIAAGVAYAGSAILGNGNKQKSATAAAQDRRQMVRSTIMPRTLVYGTARVAGPLAYASSSGSQSEFLHLVVPVAGHPVAGIDAFWINDTRVPVTDLDESSLVNAGPLTGRVRCLFYDGTQTAASPQLVAESTDGWGVNHILRGVAYVYVRLEYDADAFPNGLQNIGAEIRGKRALYDPRTAGTVAFSANPALCILDYLRSPLGLACEDDEIDFDSFGAAANICDEPVQIDAAGNIQARYRLDGVLALDRTPSDIMEEMLATCGGALVYVQGRYRLHVAAYALPSDTLTASDLAGPVDIQTRSPRRELFNAVRGTFIDPSKNYQAADFPTVSEPNAIAEDGETIWRDIELPLVTDSIRAQRLAWTVLKRSREALTVKVPVKYAGLRFAVWQMLSVTLPRYGWSAKAFRVTAWTFDPASGIVTLTLTEENAASYAWIWEKASKQYTAPNTNLVSPYAVPAPAGLAVSEELYATAGGTTTRTRAVLTWAAAANPFVSGYDVQYRRMDAPAGVIGGLFEPSWATGTGTQGELRSTVDDLADGLYQFRVRARTQVSAGAWTTTQFRTGALAAKPPADVTGLSVQTIGGMAWLRWDLHPDVDVRAGGRIEFRHTPDTVAPSWVGSTGLGEAAPGYATFTALPLKPGSYLAKAVDAGGRYSVGAAAIGTAQATVIAFANVDTLLEDPGFSGAAVNALTGGGVLRLDSGGDVDSEPDFDAIPDIDALGGVAAEGSYTFASGLDLGAVRPIRLTGRIVAIVVDSLDTIDQRVGDVDDWLDFDGVAGGEADAWIEMRQTDDDPAGTPTWSAWRRLDAAEAVARGFQFRLQLRSYDLTSNIEITELSVTADEVA